MAVSGLLPVSLGFAGQTDASGNYTSPAMRPNPTLWATFRVVGQVVGDTGYPRWTVQVAGAVKAPALGPIVDPAVVAQPGQNVVVSVTGALPNAQLTGTLEGVAGPTFESISSFVSVTSNTLAAATTQSDAAVPGSPFTVALDGGIHVLGTFTIPTGVQAMVIATSVASNIRGYQVIGSVTGIDYGPGSFPNPKQRNYVKLHPIFDPTVQVQVTSGTGGGNYLVDVALLYGLFVVSQDQGAVNPVALVSSAGQYIGSRLGRDSIPGVSVSLEESNPPPWMAPGAKQARFAGSVAASSTANIIPASVGKTVYLFGGTAAIDGTPGNVGTLQDTGAGNLLDFGLAAVTPLALFGVPLSVGLGLQVMNTDTAAHTFRVSIGYSQI